MLKVTSVLGNSQRLDGGAMFGNAPRALWSRWATPDELGRIALVCRAFLVEDGEKRVLLEVGIGAFFEPELCVRCGRKAAAVVSARALRGRAHRIRARPAPAPARSRLLHRRASGAARAERSPRRRR